jgi:hypothetical protein
VELRRELRRSRISRLSDLRSWVQWSDSEQSLVPYSAVMQIQVAQVEESLTHRRKSFKVVQASASIFSQSAACDPSISIHHVQSSMVLASYGNLGLVSRRWIVRA